VSALDSTVEQPGLLTRFRKKRVKRELPYPMGISPLRRPLRWSFGRLKELGNKGLLTWAGTLVAATFYWLVFQTTTYMKGHWDYQWVTDSTTRHLYRAAMEAAAAGFVVRIIGYNHYKAVKKDGMGFFKRFIVNKLHISQPGDGQTMGLGGALWAMTVWLVLATGVSVGIVWFLTQKLGISLAQDTVGATLPTNPTFADRMEYSAVQIVNNWPLKLVIFAVFISTSWIIKGIADDVQVFIIQWMQRRGHKLNRLEHAIYPDPFIARYNEICKETVDDLVEFSGGSTIGIKLMIAVLAAMTIAGWFAVNSKLPHAHVDPPPAAQVATR
jgi:hypothetical protein